MSLGLLQLRPLAHSTVKVRPRTCGVPDRTPPEHGPEGSSHRRQSPRMQLWWHPARLSWLMWGTSCRCWKRSQTLCNDEMDSVIRLWQRDQPRTEAREPSSPFAVMNWAGVDEVRIPTFVIVQFKDPENLMTRMKHVHLFIRPYALRSSGETAGPTVVPSGGLEIYGPEGHKPYPCL